MLNEGSILKAGNIPSPLAAQSWLRPKGSRKKRPLLFALMLTSLIDAFSILVIYLLINFSAANQSLQMSQGLELPSAFQTSDIGLGTVVSINNGRYFIQGREVPMDQIARRLYDIRRTLTKKNEDDKGNIIIEADKHVDYASLNPIILGGAQAGFHHYKFAVIQEGDSK